MRNHRLMPEVGLEPTWTYGPRDFESRASTNFTTPAIAIIGNIYYTIFRTKSQICTKQFRTYAAPFAGEVSNLASGVWDVRNYLLARF